MSLWSAAALYLCVPLTLVLLRFLPKPGPPPAPVGHHRRRDGRTPVSIAQRLHGPRTKRTLAAGWFVAGCAAVWSGYDGLHAAFARIEHYADLNEYDKVLAAAGPLKVLNAASEVRLQLALYHTGRLTQDLFAHTNQAAWNLLPGLGLGLDACGAQCRTLFELGQVNEAEHLAHELLELDGNRPDLLRLLAQVNILKDRPQAARIFLNLLRDVPFHRAWAEARLRSLDVDPRLSDDPDLALIRSRMPTTDLPHDELPTESFLLQLLDSNPRNQMALEYLLAHYLVTCDLEHLVKHLGQLRDLGRTALPRHVEEAVLLYQKLKNAQVDLQGCGLRPQTAQRFHQFAEALDRARRNPDERPALERDFGDTFWLYFYTRPAQRR